MLQSRYFYLLSLFFLFSCIGEQGSIHTNPDKDGGVLNDSAQIFIDGSTGADASLEVDASIPPPQSRLVYVSVGGESRLAVVELGVDGILSARTELDLGLSGNPGALSYAKNTSRIYVGLQEGSVETIGLGVDGTPSSLGLTEATGNPVYLSLVRNESLLVTAYFGKDEIKIFDVVGLPPHTQRDQKGVNNEPHAAMVGPTGNRIYVPHRNGGTTQWFDINASGQISLVGELQAENGVGPRHIDFTPSGNFAYIVNEFDDSISAHRVSADGSLVRFQSLSTIPDNFDGDNNTCADVHVLPGGKFVYASNRGHDSIAMFAIAGDGGLTSMGTVETEERPREFSVSPDGRFVIVSGQSSGYLQSYKVEENGSLSSVNRLRVGPDLRWAVIR